MKNKWMQGAAITVFATAAMTGCVSGNGGQEAYELKAKRQAVERERKISDEQNYRLNNALFEAAKQRDIVKVKTLHEMGATIEASRIADNAACDGNLPVLAYVFQQTREPLTQDAKQNLVFHASQCATERDDNNFPVLQLLHDNGVDLRHSTRAAGIARNATMIRFMVEDVKVDAEAINEMTKNALSDCRLNDVRYLVEAHHADVNEVYSGIIDAVTKGDFETVEYAGRHGADFHLGEEYVLQDAVKEYLRARDYEFSDRAKHVRRAGEANGRTRSHAPLVGDHSTWGKGCYEGSAADYAKIMDYLVNEKGADVRVAYKEFIKQSLQYSKNHPAAKSLNQAADFLKKTYPAAFNVAPVAGTPAP